MMELTGIEPAGFGMKSPSSYLTSPELVEYTGLEPACYDFAMPSSHRGTPKWWSARESNPPVVG